MNPVEWYNQFLRANEREDLVWFAGIILTTFLLKAFFSSLLSRQFFKVFKQLSQGNSLQDFMSLLKKPFELLVLILMTLVAFGRLTVPGGWAIRIGKTRYPFDDIFILGGKLAISISVIWILLRSADFIGHIYMRRALNEGEKADRQVIRFFRDIIKVFIVLTGLMFIFGSVLKFNVTSLITGLGIGGLAIALALQETIANLIGSFVIFLDKPFAVGDIIESEQITGVVESVGFRSTRIRTYDKSLLTVPNKKLVDSALNNLSRTEIRRVKMLLHLPGDSDLESVKKLIEGIENIVMNHPDILDNFQVKFWGINESDIIIQVIYHVNNGDLDFTANIRHEMNIKIMQELQTYGLKLIPNQIVVRK